MIAEIVMDVPRWMIHHHPGGADVWCEQRNELVGVAPCAPYSSNDFAALDVMQRMGERGYTTFIEWKGSGREFAGTAEVTMQRFLVRGHGVGALAHAICLAALRAIEAAKVAHG